MPDLLAEMRDDLIQNPLYREFVLLKRGWAFNTRDQILAYYFDDHPELKNQVLVLENHGLIIDVTSSNVDRYRLTESFVEYLAG